MTTELSLVSGRNDSAGVAMCSRVKVLWRITDWNPAAALSHQCVNDTQVLWTSTQEWSALHLHMWLRGFQQLHNKPHVLLVLPHLESIHRLYHMWHQIASWSQDSLTGCTMSDTASLENLKSQHASPKYQRQTLRGVSLIEQLYLHWQPWQLLLFPIQHTLAQCILY